MHPAGMIVIISRVRLARMSNGPTASSGPWAREGRQGTKHHENLLTLSAGGVASKLIQILRPRANPGVTRPLTDIGRRKLFAIVKKPGDRPLLIIERIACLNFAASSNAPKARRGCAIGAALRRPRSVRPPAAARALKRNLASTPVPPIRTGRRWNEFRLPLVALCDRDTTAQEGMISSFAARG